MSSTQNAPVHEHLPADLTKGYAAFLSGRLRREQDRFRTLAEQGQKPPALLIGCCDSRVSPEVIFDAGPGEIFVVRNIAALVPPYNPASMQETAAAIEYAVLALKVAHILVMGHAQCGGIRAYAQGAQDEFKPLSDANFVAKWKALIAPAAERAGAPGADFDHYCEDPGAGLDHSRVGEPADLPVGARARGGGRTQPARRPVRHRRRQYAGPRPSQRRCSCR